MSDIHGYSLFSVFGIEIEYAIVDRDSLDVRALAPEALHAASGTWTGDHEDGAIGWSNELVAHVLELRTNGPVPSLAGVADQFRDSASRLARFLDEWNAMLMPTAMHPWMDPRAETVLWPHENSEIYAAYDRIFDCHRHGWANVQSTHLNLPFAGEEEFARLMAACRLVLPLVPAIAASSPIVGGRPTGMLDTRLEHYRTNAERVPHMAGAIIPERIFGVDEYMERVLRPISAAIRPLDDTGVLSGNEWLNARGAIARFDRGSIEIRLIDSQEHPAADLAVVAAVTGVVRGLADERWSSASTQRAIPVEPLADLLGAAAVTGPATPLPEGDVRAAFGPVAEGTETLGDLWRRLCEESFAGPPELEQPLAVVLERGTLAERILAATGPNPDRGRLKDAWKDLCDCLAAGRSFGMLFIICALTACAAPSPSAAQDGVLATRADTLRGTIGPARVWWDVLRYDLDVRVNPADSSVSGHNKIVYRVLGWGDEMQIDLQAPLTIDSVTRRGRALEWRSEGNAHFVMLDERPVAGEIDTVTVYYSGQPRIAPNPPWDGGLIVSSDSLGRPWIATANQGLGASVWWPTKDTQTDEPDEGQRIAITVPEPLVDVSNGRLQSVVNHPDGTTTWEWIVAEPINNYNVTITAGHYAHFTEFYEGEDGILTLDYWPLDYHLEAARRQFRQVPSVMQCFEHWFGPYPWYRDGFKLIETPHLGMEHQSGVAYGNGYVDGYRGTDLSGTGHGLEWDFIIVHETAHEWWGNNITSADLADMWVHESFANYAEYLYTECLKGPEAGADYAVGVRGQVRNDRPIIADFGVNASGSGDMYYKGGNMLHAIRQLVGDDDKWRAILRGLNETFRHQVVTGQIVRDYISREAGLDLDPVFRQYLTTTGIPVLEFRRVDGEWLYRWTDVVDGFAMPVELETPAGCTLLRPTDEWQSLEYPLGSPAEFDIDRDYYAVLRLPDGPDRPAAGKCPRN